MKRGDPIIDELHKFRDKLARRHGFDVKKIAEGLRAREGEHPSRVTSRPARRVSRKIAS